MVKGAGDSGKGTLEVALATCQQEIATLREQRDQLQEELETVKADEVWSVAEHQRAITAIRHAGDCDPHAYPSFVERVWWRAFEAELKTFRAALATCQQERDEWQRTAGHYHREMDLVTIKLRACQQTQAALRRLAKEATNGWACYASRKAEHDEVARLHGEIDALSHGDE